MEESTPLLPQCTRRSSWPNIWLLLITFMQIFGLNVVDIAPKQMDFNFVNIKVLASGQFMWVFAAFLYFLPITIGTLTDTVTGRYTAMCIGLGLKTLGSLIGFLAILIYESHADPGDINEIEVNFILGAYGVYLGLLGLGCLFYELSMMNFLVDQVEQTPQTVSSCLRWLIWTVFLSLVVFDGLVSLQPDGMDKDRYYQTACHAILLGMDVLSVFFLMLGRSKFSIATLPPQGKASWNEAVNIIKTYVFCMKPKRQSSEEEMTQFEWQTYTSQRRGLDRLKLKKTAFFFMYLSALSFPVSTIYMVHQLFKLTDLFWDEWLATLLCHGGYMLVIIAIPLAELVIRIGGYHLWQDTTANLLKTTRIGTVLSAVALLIAGGLAEFQWANGGYAKDVYMFLPPFIIIGMTTPLLLPAAMTYCYLESAKGLATFTTTLILQLAFLVFGIANIFSSALHIKDGILCFILAGLTVGFLPIGEISVIWFNNAKAAINKYLESEEGERISVMQEDDGGEPV